MKILLDENVPVNLKKDFSEFEVSTVTENKWNGIKNGELLKLMEQNDFNFLITLDKKLRYQQNLDKFKIKVILFDVRDSRINKLKLLVERAIEILKSNKEDKFNSIVDD